MTKEANFVAKIRGPDGPELYFKEILGVETLEPFQIEKILRPIALYGRVAIAATHSVGKTWSMARIALWFLTSFKNSKVITTAPTNRQVEKLLWGELHSAYNKSKMPIGGRLLSKELKINPDWYAMGFSPQKEAGVDSKEQKGSSFQGFHADYVLIIFDEATGVPADVWTMAEGLLTSGKIVKFVAIANPTTRASEFFKCFSDPSWHKVYLSCFDSPNLVANGITDMHRLQREINKLKEIPQDERLLYIENYLKPVPHLLSCQWVLSRALKWGIDHPLFQSKALGKFPDLDDNVIVQLEDVEAAIARELDILSQPRLRCIGVDVARYGDDSTQITTLIGNKQTGKKEIRKRSITEVSGETIKIIDSDLTIPTRVLVDCTGVGAGVHDILKEHYRLNPMVEIIEIHFGQSPVMSTDKGNGDEKDKKIVEEITNRYFNLKARMYDLLSHDIKNNLAIINEDIYLEELPSIKVFYNSKGKMQVESKDDYKSRTGKGSPDSSDSLALANLGRHRKLIMGFFSGMASGKVLNRNEKTSDTMKRIESRIKANKY